MTVNLPWVEEQMKMKEMPGVTSLRVKEHLMNESSYWKAEVYHRYTKHVKRTLSGCECELEIAFV